MRLITEAPIQYGTKVFVRCDIDVPIEKGSITEEYRLHESFKTLDYIIQNGGFPVIAGHIGQPHGVVDPKFSTKPIISYYEEKLGHGKFKLLENLRFDVREEENNNTYAKELAGLADIYVNESFATCHREHTSIVGVPKFLPGYTGFSLYDQVRILQKIITMPVKPFVVIIGGTKLESKLPLVDTFIKIADFVMLGGRLGLEWKEEIPKNLLLPADYADDQKDIGPETIKTFIEKINKAKTILWAGPMGMYENPDFIKGTKEIAKAIITSTEKIQTTSIIGGGDTIAAVNKTTGLDGFTHTISGGGAMLYYLTHKTLPGIEVLK